MCLGKNNLTYTEPSERCFNVSGIYRHEGFRYPTVPTVEFDIALVRLDWDVVPSDQIAYACLPSEEEVLPKDKMCYATGWGDETGEVWVSWSLPACTCSSYLYVHTHRLNESHLFINFLCLIQ